MGAAPGYDTSMAVQMPCCLIEDIFARICCRILVCLLQCTATRRRLTRGGRSDARSGFCSPELLQTVLQACGCDLAISRHALRPVVDYAEAAAGGGGEGTRVAAWDGAIAAGAAVALQQGACEPGAATAGRLEVKPEAAAAGSAPAPQEPQPGTVAAGGVADSSVSGVAATLASTVLSDGGPGLREAITTPFLVDVSLAAAALYAAATAPGAPPQALPQEEPEWRRLRSREPLWSAAEVRRMPRGLPLKQQVVSIAASLPLLLLRSSTSPQRFCATRRTSPPWRGTSRPAARSSAPPSTTRTGAAGRATWTRGGGPTSRRCASTRPSGGASTRGFTSGALMRGHWDRVCPPPPCGCRLSCSTRRSPWLRSEAAPATQPPLLRRSRPPWETPSSSCLASPSVTPSSCRTSARPSRY